MFLKLSALIAVAATIFLSGISYGKKIEQAKCQEKQIESQNDTFKIIQKSKTISNRNSSLDRDALIERL